MATITEDYVSFQVARLLKDKGFSENTICKYADVGGITEKWYDDYRERVLHFDWDEGYLIKPPIEPKDQYEITGDTISAPTLQMAMKWLRKVYNLCLFAIPATIDKTFRTGYALYPQCDSKWEWCASKNDRSKATFGFDINKKYCDSYEQACEECIKYSLENLI